MNFLQTLWHALSQPQSDENRAGILAQAQTTPIAPVGLGNVMPPVTPVQSTLGKPHVPGGIQRLIEALGHRTTPDDRVQAQQAVLGNPTAEPNPGILSTDPGLLATNMVRPEGPPAGLPAAMTPVAPSKARMGANPQMGTLSRGPVSNARQAMDVLVSMGWSPHHAAAAVGNYQQESGKDLNPQAYNAKEGAFGIGQWRGDRLENLKQFAGTDDLDNIDLHTQLRFGDWETKNTEKAAGDAFFATGDAASGAGVWDSKFERSSGEHVNQRVANANALMAEYGDGGGASLGSSNGPVEAPMFPEEAPQSGPNYKDGYTERTGGGLMDRFSNFVNDQNGGDKLLAIGTGLLSGNDWSSGIAAAGGNLLGLSKDAREEAIDQQKEAEDHWYRNESLKNDQARLQNEQSRIDQAGQPDAASWSNLGAVEMPDGTITTGFTNNSQPGVFDSSGNRLDGATPITRSNAGGDKGILSSADYGKQTKELQQLDTDIAGLDRTIDHVSKLDPAGLSRGLTGLTAAVKSVTGQGLSPDEINQKVARGELQGLVGALRESVVGGGVMTEQDAKRVIMRMGGDLSSMMENPQVILEQLRILRAEREGIFNDRNSRFNGQVADSGVAGYSPYTSIRSGGALSSTNTEPTPEAAPSDDEVNSALELYK